MPDDLTLFRRNTEITFDPHVFIRQLERNFDLDFVEETVREGEVVSEKSDLPSKACFKRYHGKERVTYWIIAIFHQEFIEVKTVWLTLGR